MSDSPIKIEVGAKLEVKTEIPSDASGRLVHAIADAASPITQWLGMQGDKIRIHRHVVVQKLIKRAEEQLALENARPHPISTKIAVRLIELASLEEPDDEFMIDMWAKLLASAATNLTLFYQQARTTFLGEELLVLVRAIEDDDTA